MVTRTVHVSPESEIGKIIEQARTEPLVIDMAGERFRLTRERDAEHEDIWADYDPDALRDAFDETVGIYTPEEAKARIAALYEARERGTRPIDRP